MHIFCCRGSFFLLLCGVHIFICHLLNPITFHFYWINSNSKWRRASREMRDGQIQVIIVQWRKRKPRRLWGLSQSSEYTQRSQSYGQRKENLEGTRWGLGPRFTTVTLDISAPQVCFCVFFSSIKWNYNAYLSRARWEFNENLNILCKLWSTPQLRGRRYCNDITVSWALSGALY